MSRIIPVFALLMLTCIACAPDLAAQSAPFGMPGGRPPASAPPGGIATWLLSQQAEFHRALSSGMRQVATNPSALWGLIALAFSYGVLHAIGPGHGKAVIASYLVANETSLKRGVMLAFGAAFVQAIVALLVVITVSWLMQGTARTIEATTRIIEQIGFTIILAMGLSILWRKLRALRSGPHNTASCAVPDCGHDHGLNPDLHGASTPRDLILTAIGAGIRPCAGAIIVLVFALTQGLLWAGAIAVSAMAIGTAIGTSIFALLAVKAKQLALSLAAGRTGWASRAILVLEALAGFVLAMLGLALLIGAMETGA